MTLFQIRELDAGKEFSEEFALTRIPTVKEFILSCDGIRRKYTFDPQGKCVIKLESGDENIRIRVEKSGKEYPLFYAFSTVNTL